MIGVPPSEQIWNYMIRHLLYCVICTNQTSSFVEEDVLSLRQNLCFIEKYDRWRHLVNKFESLSILIEFDKFEESEKS